MTGPKRTAPPNKSSTGKTAEKPLDPLPPLKPRPVVFIVLWVVLVLWLVALVVMRLKTVQPAPPGNTEPPPLVQ